jgi:hypothetical protein
MCPEKVQKDYSIELLATMQQYSLSMNEEGCQLDFLNTDLRLELVSDTVIQISITRSSEHTDFVNGFQSQPV